MGKTNAKEEAFCRWHSPRRQGHASARRGFSGVMADWSTKLGLLALLLLLPAIGVLAQKTVKGTVKSQDGEPLIGVSVLVKGTGSGSTTDMNGAYTVNARTGQTLVFSYVGFTSKTVKVNGPTLNVTLDEDSKSLEAAKAKIGEMLDAETAEKLGLVTFAFDDVDWEDEIRIFLEERASFSPDGLTGLEANLRFGGPETMESKIFARLTAWQNWIFQRPNAVGEQGALRRYGTGQKPVFDTQRV